MRGLNYGHAKTIKYSCFCNIRVHKTILCLIEFSFSVITSASGSAEKILLVHKYFVISFFFFTVDCCLTLFLSGSALLSTVLAGWDLLLCNGPSKAKSILFLEVISICMNQRISLV